MSTDPMRDALQEAADALDAAANRVEVIGGRYSAQLARSDAQRAREALAHADHEHVRIPRDVAHRAERRLWTNAMAWHRRFHSRDRSFMECDELACVRDRDAAGALRGVSRAG